MRWKIIVVNAGILLVVGLLSYVLLHTGLQGVLSNPSERKEDVAQALRGANAQLALDAVRLERWLRRQCETSPVAEVFGKGTPEARSEAATLQANRLRDAMAGQTEFSRMAPSLVLFVDEQGVAIGRDGSALMRGEPMGKVYPSLQTVLKEGASSSAVWLDRSRQEQLLVSMVPVRKGADEVVGAVAIGTPLNDERVTRTSQLTSGQPLLLEVVSKTSVEVLAHSSNVTADLIREATSASVARSAQGALASNAVVSDEPGDTSHVFGSIRLSEYAGQRAVLTAALPVSRVKSVAGLLWPVLFALGLGIVLVVIAGFLLGNYISGPISELEDGLLSIINGNTGYRFQLEHDELGGLVFRINSLLNALMGVAEDTTDDQGRPSQGPRAQDFQEP